MLFFPFDKLVDYCLAVDRPPHEPRMARNCLTQAIAAGGVVEGLFITDYGSFPYISQVKSFLELLPFSSLSP
jgi:hypothetical protein